MSFREGVVEGETQTGLNDFTVIIPTLGRPILQKCLQSVVSGNRLPARIILIDQGENPEVAEWVESIKLNGLDIHHVRSMERSPSSARNQGLSRVQTLFVAALDDDCLAERDWLEKMQVKLQENPEAIITGSFLPAGDGIPPTVVTSTVPRIFRRPSIRFPSPLQSGNMGFSLRIAQRIGPFDEKLISAEDIDWAYRALRLGIPILYAPEIVVNHFHWRNESQLNDTFREYGWGLGAFYGKHLRRGDLTMVVRIVLSFFRGVRGLWVALIKNDADRRKNSMAKISRLFDGVVDGFFSLGFHHE